MVYLIQLKDIKDIYIHINKSTTESCYIKFISILFSVLLRLYCMKFTYGSVQSS